MYLYNNSTPGILEYQNNFTALLISKICADRKEVCSVTDNRHVLLVYLIYTVNANKSIPTLYKRNINLIFNIK